MRLLLILLVIFYSIRADVLKPALVEITFFDKNKLEITFDLNLEAILSGISTNYKNTKGAPNSDKYNEFRRLEEQKLKNIFINNQEKFLESISLKINDTKVKLNLKSIYVDIVGYTSRGRKSTITYEATLNNPPKTLIWRYNEKYGDNAFRYRAYKKNEYTWSQWSWLRGNNSSEKIVLKHRVDKSKFDIFIHFIKLGFLHVIPLGFDHILFIVGMALSSVTLRQLLILVTSFTLAHSITLGLSTLDIINISSSIIEPLIAFSIAYIAIENLIMKQSIKRKTIVVFSFGLLHGLGFASMLKTFDMVKSNFLATLAGFNIGVEIAQISIILGVLFTIFLVKKYSSFYKLYINTISISIAITALYWTMQRLNII